MVLNVPVHESLPEPARVTCAVPASVMLLAEWSPTTVMVVFAELLKTAFVPSAHATLASPSFQLAVDESQLPDVPPAQVYESPRAAVASAATMTRAASLHLSRVLPISFVISSFPAIRHATEDCGDSLHDSP